MKMIVTPHLVTLTNAWGGVETLMESTHEVEETDVGETRQNHLGRGRPGYTFKSTDVGRKISVRQDRSTYWFFE